MRKGKDPSSNENEREETCSGNIWEEKLTKHGADQNSKESVKDLGLRDEEGSDWNGNMEGTAGYHLGSAGWLTGKSEKHVKLLHSYSV